MQYLYTAGPVLILLYMPCFPHDHPEPEPAYSQEATAAPIHDSEQAINAQLVDKQRGFTKRTLLGIKHANDLIECSGFVRVLELVPAVQKVPTSYAGWRPLLSRGIESSGGRRIARATRGGRRLRRHEETRGYAHRGNGEAQHYPGRVSQRCRRCGLSL